MATTQHASYDDWRRAYEDTYDALPQHSDIVCPNCGHTTLRLEFVARESDHIGYAMFWCDTCIFGIHISRTWVPTGAKFYPMSTPEEELGKIVPEYTVVYPPPDPEDSEDVTS